MKHVNLSSFHVQEIKSALLRNKEELDKSENYLRYLSSISLASIESSNCRVPIWLVEAAKALPSTYEDIDIEEFINIERAIFIQWFVINSCRKVPVLGTLLEGVSSFSSLFRKREIYSLLEGRKALLKYIDWKDVEKVLVKFSNSASEIYPLSKMMSAIMLSASFVAVHPFSDENGRSARRVIQEMLREGEIWKGRVLPIGFLIYRDRVRFLECQNNLFVNGNWDSYVKYMLSLIKAAAELAVVIDWRKVEGKLHEKK